MDEQIKIKILKSFDHGLQKPFSKNKEERISKPIWIIGYQITFSPLLKKRKI
jgi:lysyl-tRNA synthetase class II